MEVFYHPRALREVERLPRALRTRVLRAIEQLADDPSLGKPLVGELQGMRSRRVGEYRIVFMAETDRLYVLHVGPRGGAYGTSRRRGT